MCADVAQAFIHDQGSLVAPVKFEQNINNAVYLLQSDNFGALGQNRAEHRITAWHTYLLLCPEGN